jgi:hypothetical protein
MSIEALWAVQFTGANGVRFAKSGGVIVLETGRIFGGDTWMWYTGAYKRLTEDGKYSISLQTGIHFTEGGGSIFGGPLKAQRYTGEAQVSADQKSMTAKLTVEGDPQMALNSTLTRVAELP